MSDYIKREDVLGEFTYDDLDEYYTPQIMAIVGDIPSADVAPVRHGRWLNCKLVESGFKFVCCSECKYNDLDSRLYKYCPNCGAKMDGGDDDEKRQV